MGPGYLSGDSSVIWSRNTSLLFCGRRGYQGLLADWNDHAGEVFPLHSSGDRLAGWLSSSSVCGLFKWRQFESGGHLLAWDGTLRFFFFFPCRTRRRRVARRAGFSRPTTSTVWRWSAGMRPNCSGAYAAPEPPMQLPWTRRYVRVKGKGRTCIERWIPAAPPRFPSLSAKA